MGFRSEHALIRLRRRNGLDAPSKSIVLIA
jgi:hypothetical protein